MKADAQAWHDAQVIVTGCALCPRWQFIGPASEGRARAVAHRAKRHPDLRPTRRRRGNLQRFNPSDDGYRAEGLANAARVAEALRRLEEVA